MNAIPSTFTRAPLMSRPAVIIYLTVCSATNLPIPSLIRRPARIT